MTCTRTAGSCRLQRCSLAARFEASARRVPLPRLPRRECSSPSPRAGRRDFPPLSGERNVPSDWHDVDEPRESLEDKNT
eukprot:4196995-Prymnesium_polylepis.1